MGCISNLSARLPIPVETDSWLSWLAAIQSVSSSFGSILSFPSFLLLSSARSLLNECAMDNFEEDDSNIWARQSPEQAQSELQDASHATKDRQTILAPEGGPTLSVPDSEPRPTLKSVSSSFNADKDAWNALSDDEDDYGDEQFVEATSRLDLSASGASTVDVSLESEPESAPVPGPSSPPRLFSKPFPSETSASPLDDLQEDDGQDGFRDSNEQDTTTVRTGDDDDDFGAFDEADEDADFGSFETPIPPASASSGPNLSYLPTPVPPDTGPPPSPSSGPGPGFIDFASIGYDAESTRPHILNYFKQVWPDLLDQIDFSIPERQLEGRANILHNQELKDGFHELVEKDIEYTPFDWKRSQTRRSMMQAMGVPVNLDDVRLSSLKKVHGSLQK